jgi:GNAT superfamily N-acetyltransferase
MKIIQTKTTYLEMLSPADVQLFSHRTGVSIARISSPSVEFYLSLYRGVGADYCWVDRLAMPGHQLQAIIQDDHVDVFVMSDDEGPLGYCELDRRTLGEIELAYFGLLPRAIGQGLGKYLLHFALQKAWSHQPQRVWVHTCDLDHPAALPLYLKTGFQVYDEKIVDQRLI